MNIHQFKGLRLIEKQEYLSKNGRYIISTSFYGASVKLFAVNSAFIEVYYHPVLKKIMRISVATDRDLRKHLEAITLNLD